MQKKIVVIATGCILSLLLVGAVQAEGENTPAQEVEQDISKPFVYNDQNKRDPLWPLVSPNGILLSYDTELSPNDLTLEGIMVGSTGADNIAIINSRIVKQKDKMGQFVVETITQNTVVLKSGQQEVVLTLKKEE